MAAFFVRPIDCVRNSEIYFIILSFSVWIAPIMNGNRHLCPDFFFFFYQNKEVPTCFFPAFFSFFPFSRASENILSLFPTFLRVKGKVNKHT